MDAKLCAVWIFCAVLAVTSATNDVVCPTPNAYVQDKHDCSKFYQCSNGRPIAQQCPSGLYFDPRMNWCNWPEQTDCRTAPETTNTPAVTTKVTPSDIICPALNAYVPNENDCSRFYQCSNGRPVAKQCRAGLYFDIRINVCNWAEHTECGNRPKLPIVITTVTPEIPENNPSDDVLCETSNAYIPDKHDCSKFYQCSNGRPISQQCPSGLYFDKRINVCNWPEQTECRNAPESTDTPAVTRKVKPSDDVICPTPNAYVPDKHDCSKFYECSNGTPIAQQCPSGLYFDPILNLCNWPEQTDCRPAPENTTTPAVTTKVTPSDTTIPSNTTRLPPQNQTTQTTKNPWWPWGPNTTIPSNTMHLPAHNQTTQTTSNPWWPWGPNTTIPSNTTHIPPHNQTTGNPWWPWGPNTTIPSNTTHLPPHNQTTQTTRNPWWPWEPNTTIHANTTRYPPHNQTTQTTRNPWWPWGPNTTIPSNTTHLPPHNQTTQTTRNPWLPWEPNTTIHANTTRYPPHNQTTQTTRNPWWPWGPNTTSHSNTTKLPLHNQTTQSTTNPWWPRGPINPTPTAPGKVVPSDPNDNNPDNSWPRPWWPWNPLPNHNNQHHDDDNHQHHDNDHDDPDGSWPWHYWWPWNPKSNHGNKQYDNDNSHRHHDNRYPKVSPL